MTSPTHIPRPLRREVVERAKLICEYCRAQQQLLPDTFEVDHIVPRSLGGATSSDNLCLACPVCNSAKGQQRIARDPLTNRRVQLFHPRRQRWVDHFEWSDEFGEIVGRTPTGRATVAALDMNRPQTVRLRRIFAEYGWHPPPDS